jgi:hypothetical protein
VCISLVYWLPWSVLNISGCGYFSKASLSTLITNCESIVLDILWVLQYPWMAKAEPQTNFTIEQKLDYAKLMVNENYINKKIMAISGAGPSAVTRWKRQYLAEKFLFNCKVCLWLCLCHPWIL